jgi:hypothetical protein
MKRCQDLSKRTQEHRTPPDESHAAYFLGRLNNLSNDHPSNLVFNRDETCWRLFEMPTKTLVEKGPETVKLRSKTNEQTSFAALGARSATGQKLSLWLVAKRKTQRCERKFTAHLNVFISHTDSGWAAENLIVRSLDGCTAKVPTTVHVSSHWTSIRAIEGTLLMPPLMRMIWSDSSFQPAQQEDFPRSPNVRRAQSPRTTRICVMNVAHDSVKCEP